MMAPMDIIEQGVKTFGTAADLARAMRHKFTPQAISIAKKRGSVSDALRKAIASAIRRNNKQSARHG